MEGFFKVADNGMLYKGVVVAGKHVFFRAGLLFCVAALITGFLPGQILAPEGLSVEMLTFPERTVIRDLNPEFGWEVRSLDKGSFQSAFQLQVREEISGNSETREGRLIWDSGKTVSPSSVNREYQGGKLKPDTCYLWRVRIWDQEDNPSKWSEFQCFRTAEGIKGYETSTYPLETRLVHPVRFSPIGSGYFYDFGKAAFGTVQIRLPVLEKSTSVIVRFAEKLSGEDTIDTNPPGSVRFREVGLEAGKGAAMLEVRIPVDKRNTGPAAILMPVSVGEVLPFRYCEIVAPGIVLDKDSVVMKVVNYPFNDQASGFVCSDEDLNSIWEICKYSIKATSFTGIYIDGDRERIAYEADAYINQLGHYLTDREYSMARATHEHLIRHPTWPTEWILHSVLIAWEDYLYTGNLESAEFYYEDLKNKTLCALTGENGLISTAEGRVGKEVQDSVYLKQEMRDIVDWPPGSFTEGGTGERDGHVMTDYNTVVNAFHFRSLVLISRLAEALGKSSEAEDFLAKANKVKEALNSLLLDGETGIYRDGIGTEHSSLHSNMFPLAFGMVPESYRESVVEFVKSRGMACSVYGSQYLLDALFEAGEEWAAMALLTAEHDRGWLNMIRSGSTVTLEAWDWKYKNNLDWNHAWGAAPANLIPRWILGVRPLEPGFEAVVLRPHTCGLEWARGKVPTIRGPVWVEFSNQNDDLEITVEIPGNVKARMEAPESRRIFLDGSEINAPVERGRHILILGSGRHTIECQGVIK